MRQKAQQKHSVKIEDYARAFGVPKHVFAKEWIEPTQSVSLSLRDRRVLGMLCLVQSLEPAQIDLLIGAGSDRLWLSESVVEGMDMCQQQLIHLSEFHACHCDLSLDSFFVQNCLTEIYH